MNIKFLKKVPTFVLAVLLTVSTFSTYYTPTVHAEGTVSVRIVGTQRTIWLGDVQNAGCSVTDKDGVIHSFAQPVALCALDAAAQAGNFSYSVKNFGGSLGLYLDAIDEDSGAADFSTYWIFDINGTPASVGISAQVTNPGDKLFIHFENPNADLNVRSINDGIGYLKSQQNVQGQINGYPGVSSWSAVAFASAGVDLSSISNGGVSLLSYLESNPPADDAAPTDWERGILAITANGKNPFSFGGVNYVQKLEGFYNNSQLGSVTLLNDDIFGLLALISSGEGASGQIKQDALSFILSHQLPDGGFGWSVNESSDIDTTSAAIQALVAATNTGINNPALPDALSRAKSFLISAQNANGGFGYLVGEAPNTSTTAWATMALSSMETDISTAKSYLRANQDENGSFRWQTGSPGETFTTSYSVIALSGKFWPVQIYAGTPQPSPTPSSSPSVTPSPSPSQVPSASPTTEPSPSPSVQPSASPIPSVAPSVTPSPSPNQMPSANPSASVTPSPTVQPTETPREIPEWITKRDRIIKRAIKKQIAVIEKMQKKLEKKLEKLSALRQRLERRK